SPFATVRLRQRVTKGAGSRTKGLLMAYKLLDMAQARWRRLDGAHLLPLVSTGVMFVDGLERANKSRRPSARAARARRPNPKPLKLTAAGSSLRGWPRLPRAMVRSHQGRSLAARSDGIPMGDYESTRQRHVQHMRAQLPEHLERLTWSVDRLRAERN